MKKSFKGFTLVEVLIVIIIVGILIAALLPRLTGSQGRARDLNRDIAVNQIGNALDLLITDVGPLNQTGDIVCFSGTSDITASRVGSTIEVDLSSYFNASDIPVDPTNTSVDGAFNGTDDPNCDLGDYAIVVGETGSDFRVVAVAETDAVGDSAIATAFASAGAPTDAELSSAFTAGSASVTYYGNN